MLTHLDPTPAPELVDESPKPVEEASKPKAKPQRRMFTPRSVAPPVPIDETPEVVVPEVAAVPAPTVPVQPIGLSVILLLRSFVKKK